MMVSLSVRLLFHHHRLQESYGVAEGEEEEDREAEGRARKPEDWQMLFDGNCDDDFKLGIAFTPGQVSEHALPLSTQSCSSNI